MLSSKFLLNHFFPLLDQVNSWNKKAYFNVELKHSLYINKISRAVLDTCLNLAQKITPLPSQIRNEFFILKCYIIFLDFPHSPYYNYHACQSSIKFVICYVFPEYLVPYFKGHF
jgi:hypothetical protein